MWSGVSSAERNTLASQVRTAVALMNRSTGEWSRMAAKSIWLRRMSLSGL